MSSSSQKIEVNGATMYYVDTGKGKHQEDAVIFLHGNPTSSYLWRNIIPHVKDLTRCLAPDLIGMGKSSKVPGIKYTFMEHYSYLSKWMESVDLPEKVHLVIHDWGTALGFHWAYEHQDRVKSITYMEGIPGPMPLEKLPELAQNSFTAIRSPAGEDMIFKQNAFIKQLMPAGSIRKLTEEELKVYNKPYEKEEDRMPMLTWPREIPLINDGPENMLKVAENYSNYLSKSSNLPKLFIKADPGFLTAWMSTVVKDWPNQREVTVAGIHFLQEDSPDLIGNAIRSFLEKDVFGGNGC